MQKFSLQIFSQNFQTFSHQGFPVSSLKFFYRIKNIVQLNIGEKTFQSLEEKSLFQTFSSKVSDLFYFFLENFLSKQNIVPIRVFRPAVGNRPYARLLPGARKLDEPQDDAGETSRCAE